MTLDEKLAEYRQLMEDIGTTEEYGESFVQAVFLALTMQRETTTRNDYIITIGKHLNIDSSKVERVIALLPA